MEENTAKMLNSMEEEIEVLKSEVKRLETERARLEKLSNENRNLPGFTLDVLSEGD
jgi:archaellum component FlaC